MSTFCTVLEDLRTQRAELRHDLARIRKDLSLCAGCKARCPEYTLIKADIEEAIRLTLEELTCPMS